MKIKLYEILYKARICLCRGVNLWKRYFSIVNLIKIKKKSAIIISIVIAEMTFFFLYFVMYTFTCYLLYFVGFFIFHFLIYIVIVECKLFVFLMYTNSYMTCQSNNISQKTVIVRSIPSLQNVKTLSPFNFCKSCLSLVGYF